MQPLELLTGHSHRAWTYEEGDDEVVVEALIRMADDVSVLNGASYFCDFTASYLDLSVTDQVTVVSDKQATDDIELELVADVDEVTLYNEGWVCLHEG